MIGHFIFDDIDTRNYEGIAVTEKKVDLAPARSYEVVTIAGRNGDLLIDNKRYENAIHSYDIVVYNDYVENLTKLRNDLLSRIGYKVLTDSFNPDEKYYAYVSEKIDPRQKVHRDAGTLQVVFSRKPQRFLLDGDEPIDFSLPPARWVDHNDNSITDHNGDKLYFGRRSAEIENPTNFESKPLIIAPRAGTIRIGNQNITVSGNTFPVYIDCDMMEVYTKNSSGAIVNASGAVSFTPNAFPTIPAGATSFETSISDIQVIPKWWIL